MKCQIGHSLSVNVLINETIDVNVNIRKCGIIYSNFSLPKSHWSIWYNSNTPNSQTHNAIEFVMQFIVVFVCIMSW